MKIHAVIPAATGILLTVAACSSSPSAAPSSGPPTAAVISSSGEPQAGSSIAPGNCPTDTTTTVPTERLADLRWEKLGPLSVPFSASAGPCQTTATTASGYAHTPAGALVAAAQITSRTSIFDPMKVATDTIEQQVIAGQARDQLLTDTKSHKPLTENSAGQLTAWSMLSYSDDTAVISLAMTNASLQGRYLTIPVTMRWDNGDWRLVAPPSGSWNSSAAVTSTLQGYVEWGKP
ncbi:hypothetical protein [Actinoplanes sp. NPDC020271]|uniref:hypothetical protein n=1 Tax=Actinoplanes sp. NPDC020271 TaxID=3363896 RepID=UPI00379A0B48